MGNAVTDDAAILLQLGLAFAAHRSFSALARQVGPRPGKPRQRVLHAGEGDLQHRLPSVGAVGEHLEDDLLAVDDRHARKFFPVALLGRRERRVEHDHLGAILLGQRGDLLGLSLADVESRGGGPQLDKEMPDNGKAQVFDELGELLEKLFPFALGHFRCLDPDQECALRLGKGREKISH